MMNGPKISFVIPLYNESAVFPALIERLNILVEKIDIPCEIVLVDDGSSDETAFLISTVAQQRNYYQALFLSRNFGHQYAITAGLKFARGTEAVMILDGDLQDPPELFFEFYKTLNEGNDVVYGVRKKRKEGFFKKISYQVFYRVLKSISSSPIDLDSGDFSMMSRRVVNIINKMPEESRFLRGMRSWIGFRQKGIEYEREARAGGEPKYTLSKLINLAYNGIFNFSVFPVKLLTFLGVICIGVSSLYFIITLSRKFLYNDVPTGFTALLFMIILFGGVQLASIGIIGEYVSRIFFQVKSRPFFIVKQRICDGKIVEEQ
jgi:polyisoprenyl-phosphate glycosyltransferase